MSPNLFVSFDTFLSYLWLLSRTFIKKYMATENKPRVNFASVQSPYPYPDFLDLQLKSFRDFLQLDTPPEERKNDGLYKVFTENFPITDTRNNFVLEFLDYYIDPPRYSISECLERGLTYSVPLKAKMKLYCTDPDHEDFGTCHVRNSSKEHILNESTKILMIWVLSFKMCSLELFLT